MNKVETMGIMAVLKEAYPYYYKDKTKEELSAAVNLWAEMFIDDDVRLVKAAVKSYIANDIKGFPPVIGQIKNSIYKLTHPEQMTEVEAWGLVSKALSNGYYDSVKEFNKLPPLIQKTIGSPDRLRDWSQVDVKTVQSVISSNFMRSYLAKSKHEQEYKQLPSDVKRLIDNTSFQLSEGISMTDNQVKNAVELAVQLLRENPELKYFEAIDKAKEMIEDEKKRLH